MIESGAVVVVVLVVLVVLVMVEGVVIRSANDFAFCTERDCCSCSEMGARAEGEAGLGSRDDR